MRQPQSWLSTEATKMQQLILSSLAWVLARLCRQHRSACLGHAAGRPLNVPLCRQHLLLKQDAHQQERQQLRARLKLAGCSSSSNTSRRRQEC